MLKSEPSGDQLTALVAIVRAARLTGDRTLEHSVKRELAERFGIQLTFQRKSQATERKGVAR